MNRRLIAFTLGQILLLEAVLMLLTAAVSLVFHEPSVPFLLSALCTAIPGGFLLFFRPKTHVIYAREGFIIVSLAWLALSLFGTLPFLLSKDIPNFADALFETVSGFTTTGATVLPNVELLSHGVLFWRSLTHLIGGMGILVFVMAVIPTNDGHGMHILRAEMPGPNAEKLVSRMSDTARILYKIYIVMTAFLVILLRFGGMSWFDSLLHAFGTAGTGGFSSMNASVGAYNSAYLDIVLGTFMILFGINFNLYYLILLHRVRDAIRSEELLVYLGIVVFSVIAIALNIRQTCESVGLAFRQSFFQVSSIITTTGYSTADFNTWPAFSRTVLVLLMFVGGCAGSTAGGLKVIRVWTLTKAGIADVLKMLHPKSIALVRINGKPVQDKNIRGMQSYLWIYALIFAFSTLLLSLEQEDLLSTFTAVSACLNNVGPGLGTVGPTGNFAGFTAAGKLLLSLDMLAGRLEIYPILLLFSPAVWKNK